MVGQRVCVCVCVSVAVCTRALIAAPWLGFYLPSETGDSGKVFLHDYFQRVLTRSSRKTFFLCRYFTS